MIVRNIDAGVRRALRAYRIESGCAGDESDAWADAHLADGIDRWRTEFSAHADPLTGTEAAFRVLKAWAQADRPPPFPVVASD